MAAEHDSSLVAKTSRADREQTIISSQSATPAIIVPWDERRQHRREDSEQPIGLAVYSCSNYPNGYFNAYGNSARKDHVDYVLHLGDYIYEYEMGVPGRDARATEPPREILTLYDYRTRIAQYRTDLDLLLSHQQFPWIPVWDDHEVANNGYRDGFSKMNNTENSFLKDGGVSVDQRKMNAVRAYFEWMPIRQADLDDNLRIWRNFKMGKLFDLIMLDTRNYDRSITTLNWNDDCEYRSGSSALTFSSDSDKSRYL